jgi:hypothetical protein
MENSLEERDKPGSMRVGSDVAGGRVSIAGRSLLLHAALPHVQG